MTIRIRNFTRKLAVLLAMAFGATATKTEGGSLDVQGDLSASNVTAQSLTLGGVTQSNWPAGGGTGSQGYQCVVVAGGTNDVQCGNNLLAAYATATTLNPTSSNRVAVLIPPGNYNLGATGLVMSTSYVDLIGLVPAQMTTKQVFTDSAGRVRAETVANVQCPVLVYASASAGTIVQSVDYVRIESMILTNTGSGFAYNPSVNGANTLLRHVSMSSMLGSQQYAGQYVDCVGGDYAFGGLTGWPNENWDQEAGIASGAFIDCVGGVASFAGLGITSGRFINCTGGDGSFSGDNDLSASGTYIDCVGGDMSFAGGGIASGTFRGCVGGDDSFGGGMGEASGTFIDCVGGDYSFGGGDPWQGQSAHADGTFIDCVGGDGSFGGGDAAYLDDTAKLRHCKGGDGSFGNFQMASDDFNYNVGGTNTFLMLPQLPTTTNGLPSGTVYNNGGALKVMP
jgi:hypothetical protein